MHNVWKFFGEDVPSKVSFSKTLLNFNPCGQFGIVLTGGHCAIPPLDCVFDRCVALDLLGRVSVVDNSYVKALSSDAGTDRCNQAFAAL